MNNVNHQNFSSIADIEVGDENFTNIVVKSFSLFLTRDKEKRNECDDEVVGWFHNIVSILKFKLSVKFQVWNKGEIFSIECE